MRGRKVLPLNTSKRHTGYHMVDKHTRHEPPVSVAAVVCLFYFLVFHEGTLSKLQQGLHHSMFLSGVQRWLIHV